MPPGRRRARTSVGWLAALLAAGTCAAVMCAAVMCAAAPTPASAAGQSGPREPDLARAGAYLASPANLIDGRYYLAIPGTADFGLTIDGALALAASGTQPRALRDIVGFIERDGSDASGRTVSDWTGIGTRYAAGGPIGKEALLAEVVGDNPRDFGGRDLIAALDGLICTGAGGGGSGAGTRCAAAGAFAYASSVFDQALAIIALLRAGQRAQAAAPIAYLESLRYAGGAFPSLIPRSGGPDVDSTAIAVMALALYPGARAAADVASGLAWIASRQERGGGFPGAGGDSVNSAALAIQAMTLNGARYRHQIAAARAYLAGQQNADGGFAVDAGGQRGSNLRASAQAVSGIVGTPYGALRATPGRTARRAAGALPVRDCTAASGVLVVVDFAHWGGPLLRACGAAPATGYALLNEGGWHTTGTEHDGPGFICRIGYAGFRHGTQYPTPRQEPCVLTPPADAYWISWVAGPGQDTWTYSQYGALASHPAPGSVELWLFGDTKVASSTASAAPAFRPGQLRSGRGVPGLADAEPAAARRAPAGHGSAGPALVVVILAPLVAVAGALAARRRRSRR